MKLRLLTFMLAASFAVAAAAATSDWPGWRGPHRDGISSETGLLKQWPKQGPPLLWKATGIGAGYSGVAVVDGRIYTMGDSSDASFVYALNEATGKPLWAAKVGKTGGGDGYPGPRCTPTVDGNLVFALGQFGDLVCVESETGKDRWRKNLSSDFGGKMMSGWGYSESPLIDGDLVICTPGGPRGALVALNKTTGVERWRTKDFTDLAAYCSAVVAEIGGKRQYVQLTAASVVGVAAEDGKVLWRAPRKGSTAVVPTPVVSENDVYVTSGYGAGCQLFKITEANGQFKAEQVYPNTVRTVMENHHGGVIKIGDHIYGHSDNKGWVCQDFKSGKMVWESSKLGKGSIAYADGHLYLRSEGGRGTVALIEASPDGYKESGRFDQPFRSEHNSWPHPVIARGKLYLRDQGILLCYNIKG